MADRGIHRTSISGGNPQNGAKAAATKGICGAKQRRGAGWGGALRRTPARAAGPSPPGRRVAGRCLPEGPARTVAAAAASGRCVRPGPGDSVPPHRGDAHASPANTADAIVPRRAGRPDHWHDNPDRWPAWPVASHACAPAACRLRTVGLGRILGGAVETAGRSSNSRARGSSLPPISRVPRGGSGPGYPKSGG